MVRRLAIGIGALVGVALTSDARGQTKPPGTQPGQIERQFQRPPEPSAKQGTITIPEAGQKPPQNADSVKVVLSRLTVEGVTAYRPDALRALYASLLEKEVTLAEIYRVVEGLTAKYRNDGYILSQVFVPAQTVEGGAVRLQAVEGYIANVRVEGGSASLRDRVKKYGEKIRNRRPLTMAALERYVLLVNDLPGVAAHAVLAPSTVPGASDLLLQLSKRRMAADVGSDNRGSKAQGPARVSADIDMHSLIGIASRTEVRGVTSFTPELTYVAVAHDQFVGAEGGKVGVAASYVFSRPQELAIIPLNLKTWSESLRLTYSQPLLRRRSRNLYVHGGIAAFNSTTKVFGVDDTIDKVRSVSLGVTFDSADRMSGVNIVDIGFTQGLKGLGASNNGERLLSRSTGRVDFRKSTLYAQRLQSLPARFSIVAGVDAQYAFTDVLASEMFSLGGELFGRGYDPSVLLNDHGANVRVDLRHSQTWSGRRPVTLMPYVFGDAGRVWPRTRIPGLAAFESAASAGGGVRLSIGTQFSGYVEVAKPFNRIIGTDLNRDPRIFAGISVR
jgi:hemolysin activation/secretion protein